MTADRKLIVCPFIAEARMLLAVLPECRKIAADSWQNKDYLIKVLNGFGEKPVVDFFASEFKESSVLNDQIVLFGSAGALAPDLEPGQLFVCDSMKFDDLFITLSVDAADKNLTTHSKTIEITSQITVREAVFAPNDRAALHAKTGAAIVDMESYFFAREAIKLGIKPLVIRFISDTADFPFKMPFANNIRQQIIASRHAILATLKHHKQKG